MSLSVEDLKVKNLYRELKVLENKKAVHASFQNKPMTLFCGNDYLGLSGHPRVIEAAKKAITEQGFGSGASRLISGTTSSHEKLERKIAEFKGFESALVFSNGYMANLAVLTVFADTESIILFDRLSHASLIDGVKLSGAKFKSFPHLDYDALETLLEKYQDRRTLIVTETAFSMDGDIADFKKLKQLKEKYNAMLIYDDAHGTGVFKEEFQGAGADIVTGTFSKAWGGLGGFVCLNVQNRDLLINCGRTFIYDTSLPPAFCQALCESLAVYEEEPEFKKRLWDNIARMTQLLTGLGFKLPRAESAILPIIVGDEKKALELSLFLAEQGFFIPAIRYPTVSKGAARLRLTVSAAHTQEDIALLEKALKKYKDKQQVQVDECGS